MLKRYKGAFDSLPDLEKEKILKGDIYLPHNFRTDCRPIRFLNDTFRQIFGNKGAGDLKEYETAPRPITMPDGDRSLSPEGGSVTFFLSSSSYGGRDQAEREAALIKDVIEGILGKHGKERFEYRAYPPRNRPSTQDHLNN